jgi:hypothetical protein
MQKSINEASRLTAAQVARQSRANAAASPRYQISAWAQLAEYGQGAGSSRAARGAFIIDTWSGLVWELDEFGKMKRIAKVPAE